jgi:hypothetical protein
VSKVSSSVRCLPGPCYQHGTAREILFRNAPSDRMNVECSLTVMYLSIYLLLGKGIWYWQVLVLRDDEYEYGGRRGELV